jgi:hypothetical protein
MKGCVFGPCWVHPTQMIVLWPEKRLLVIYFALIIVLPKSLESYSLWTQHSGKIPSAPAQGLVVLCHQL